MLIGVYPGTFDPPTIAHIAVAEAAWRHAELERVDLVVSEVPLGKQTAVPEILTERLQVLARLSTDRPWLRARSTSAQLLAEIADGYDVVIMGADKWAQVTDPAWYGGSVSARDAAVDGLPRVLVAPRPPHPLPSVDRGRVEHLQVEERHYRVSSSAVRAGRADWMAPGVVGTPSSGVRVPPGASG